MRHDDNNLTRLTRDKLLREKWLFERLFIVVAFAWVITANLGLLLLRTLQANGWGGAFLGAATAVALLGEAWVLWKLRYEFKRRAALIVGMNEMLQPPRVQPAAVRDEPLSPQVRQVFEALGPDATKH